MFTVNNMPNNDRKFIKCIKWRNFTRHVVCLTMDNKLKQHVYKAFDINKVCPIGIAHTIYVRLKVC